MTNAWLSSQINYLIYFLNCIPGGIHWQWLLWYRYDYWYWLCIASHYWSYWRHCEHSLLPSKNIYHGGHGQTLWVRTILLGTIIYLMLLHVFFSESRTKKACQLSDPCLINIYLFRYLALVTALASEADFVFIPEAPPSVDWKDKLCDKLEQASLEPLHLTILILES